MNIEEGLLVAQLKAIAEKATPGRWWIIDNHGSTMVAWAENKIHIVFKTSETMGAAARREETGNLSHWPNDWDASYIAMANPANLLAIIKMLEDATDRVVSTDALLAQIKRWYSQLEQANEAQQYRLDQAEILLRALMSNDDATITDALRKAEAFLNPVTVAGVAA